jgi:hypothetical protein
MGSSFRCFYCLKYFSEVDTLLDHTNSHEIQNGEQFLERHLPRNKRTLQVDISDLKCKLCGEKIDKLDEAKAHLERVHGKTFLVAGNGMTEYSLALQDGNFFCHVCNKNFHSFQLLNSHMNVHIVKVVCETCGAGYFNQHMLVKHKESHKTKKFDCKHCDKTYYKKSQLKYHTEIVHRGKERAKPKQCPHCTEVFKEYYKKIAHLRKVHGVKKTFQCHVCRSEFPTRRSLTEHSNRYHTEKHKCDVCSKCFAIESRLKRHMRGHTGERNFLCPVCKNAYMHDTTLKKHMRSHSVDYKFRCAECESGFHSKHDYGRHMKQWHSSE